MTENQQALAYVVVKFQMNHKLFTFHFDHNDRKSTKFKACCCELPNKSLYFELFITFHFDHKINVIKV